MVMISRPGMRQQPVIAISISLMIVFWPFVPVAANTTINSSPPNTGNYTLNDSGYITVNANITQRNADGSGGIIDLTAGTVITINNGRTLDVSANVAGKAGGTINLTAPAIIVNGTLRANGSGGGRGGTINLTGTGAAGGNNNYIDINGSAVLEAKGGNSSALGGVINIIGNGDTWVDIDSGARIETTGVTASGANEIYITGDGTRYGGVAIDVDGEIIADAPNGSNSSGGLIRFTTYDGDFKSRKNAEIYARGKGTGTGGTVDFLLSQGNQAIDFSSHLQVDKKGKIQVYGSYDGSATNTGSFRVGRSTLGTMSLDWDEVDKNEVHGVGTVYVGNFANNNTTSIASRDYDVDNEMNGGSGGAAIVFEATGDIDAAWNDSSDYGVVSAFSSGGGTINIYDESNDMTIDGLSTAGNVFVESDRGSVVVLNASVDGNAVFAIENFLDAGSATNTFNGNVAAYDDNGSGSANDGTIIYSSTGLTVTSLNTATATLTAGSGNLSVSNATVTGATTLDAAGSITGNVSTNYGTTTSATAGGDITLRDSTGDFTLSGVTSGGATNVSTSAGNIVMSNADVGTDLTMTAGTSGSTYGITLSDATVTGNSTFSAGGNVTATGNNNFTGWVQAYGEAGTGDFAGTVNITDNAGDLVLNRLTATNGTITAAAANSNMTASNIAVNNGVVDLVAPNNITVSTSTVNGSDTLRVSSTGGGDITLSGNTISTGSLTGTTAAPAGTGGLRFGTSTGNVVLNNNVIAPTVNIGSSGAPMQGNITGSGNTFVGATNFYVNSASGDITLNSDFQNATNVFSGRQVTLTDNSNALTVSEVTATNFNATVTGSGTASDLTITNANVSGSTTLDVDSDIVAGSGTNTNFGALTVNKNATAGNINIAETTAMTISSVTNSSASGTTTLASTGGAVTGNLNNTVDVTSPGTGAVTVSASGGGGTGYINLKLNTGGAVNLLADGQNGSNQSIVTRGTVGGNLTVTSTISGNTPGNILLGDWDTGRTLNVTGWTNFKSASDVQGYGTFTGSLFGNAARINWWQVGATNLAVGSVTATGSAASELFAGYGNVANFYVPDASFVDDGDVNTVDITAANGGVTIWAGDDSSKTASYIRTGISTGGDVYLWAAGDTNGNGTGTSIRVDTGNIGGDIVAVDETWNKTTGDIIINLTSGDLTTKDIGAGGNVVLTATNGSVLQNNAYGFDRNVTVYASGNATIKAGDAAGDTGSYIDTGVYIQGNAVFLAAGKNGANDSVLVVGHIDGDTTVKKYDNTAVPGDVYLGKGIGDPDLLSDTDDVLDTYGDIFVNALGDVYLNGAPSQNGAITITGNTVTIRQDMGRTKIATITTTATSGTAVDIFNYANAAIIGAAGNSITTAGTSGILLRAGNSYPDDSYAYIYGLDVNTAGSLDVYVAGDTNGTASGGVSVYITGTAGSVNAYNESGGAPRSTVIMPTP